MKTIQLIDKNRELCEQWLKYFSDCSDVLIYRGDFFGKPTDCVVSPANSFGFMDGGLDYYISMILGNHVQERLQQQIKEKYHGELLVGQAELIVTDVPQIPYCISAPTMRVPMILTNTVNVYLATKAIFYLWINNCDAQKNINTITIPGLGTGVGKVPFDICAKQMRKAYDEIWLGQYDFPLTWKESQEKHQSLYSNNYKDLQFEWGV
ncbi:MAG: macro domain-containing protein [Firmicutes bacterium]|nr:macro domain-containing protein [Bacillota bacterium]